MVEYYVGVAGWNLRKESAAHFPSQGSHLSRYAARFTAVEINSSFYRPHRRSTYERWAADTPRNFHFAVKVPKQITHVSRLHAAEKDLDEFLGQVAGLGEKLGPLLVQLPPSLAFDRIRAERFFRHLRIRIEAPVACEPRHPSWFEASSNRLLEELGVARVAADPALCSSAAEPGGCRRLVYYRWHGSPRMYYSSYDDSALESLATRLQASVAESSSVWCILDNTALGAALENALTLTQHLHTSLAAAS